MAEEEEEPQGDDVPGGSGGDGGVELAQPGLEDAKAAQEGWKIRFTKGQYRRVPLDLHYFYKEDSTGSDRALS